MLILSGLIALLATILGSFSGGGSSLILFPLLLAFVPDSYISLLIISKISASVMTATSGGMHLQKASMNKKILFSLIFSGLLGTALGTYFLQYQFNENLFRNILVVFIFLTAFYILFARDKGLNSDKERKFNLKTGILISIFSFLTNILNGIFGGTGLFMTVFLVVFLRMSFIKAIGYTMIMYAVLSSVQAVYLGLTEEFNYMLALAVMAGALVGGFFGTKMQYLKGNLWVKNAAVVMLFAIGIKMLI